MENRPVPLDRLIGNSEGLFQALPQGVAILDLDANILEANTRFLSLINLPREKILGYPLQEVLEDWRLPSSHQEDGLKQLAKYVATHSVSHEGKTLIMKDSSREEQTFRVTLRHSEFQGTAGILLTLDEATEAHKREQKIRLLQMLAKHVRASEDLPQLLFTILTCVTSGRALSFSRAFIFLPSRGGKHLRCKLAVGPGSQEEAWRIWGRIAAEDHDLDTILSQFDPEEIRNEAQRTFPELMRMTLPVNSPQGLAAKAFREQQPIWTKNAFESPMEDPKFLGRYKASEFVVVPMIAGGRSLGVIAADNLYRHRPIASEDIEFLSILAGQAAQALENAFAQTTLKTQVKHLARMNKSLSEARSKLIMSEKMAAVGSVAARITHEIRNPLTTIGGFARMILRKPEDQTKVNRNTEIIVEEVLRMEKLLQGILDYSRPSEVKPRMVDLRSMVKEVMFTFSGRHEARLVKVETKDLAHRGLAFADPDHLRQVLINLVKNAFEACENVGEVTVGIEEEDDKVAISITDTGPGMGKEEMEHLFEPFYTTKISGTGLGLPITQALVSANNGKIKVASNPNSGTTFRVIFPKNKPEGGRQETAATAQ